MLTDHAAFLTCVAPSFPPIASHFQAVRQQGGFLDAHRISTEALPAVAADLLGPHLPTAGHGRGGGGGGGDGGGGGAGDDKLSPQVSMTPVLFGEWAVQCG